MPLSTANYRLYRLILFEMVRRLDLNLCFQCGRRIATVEEFSVEHKKPWLDVSPLLFWDLSNIAFSHGSCNSNAARKNVEAMHLAVNKQKVSPKGKAWCSGHKTYLPVNQFTKSAWR